MIIYNFGFILKVLFNLAIITIIGKFCYAPLDASLKGTELIYIFPFIGMMGAYLYLSFWFGWKRAFHIILLIVSQFTVFLLFYLRDPASDWFWRSIAVLFLIACGYGIVRLGKTLIYWIKSYQKSQRKRGV